jgi:hypothetical protein
MTVGDHCRRLIRGILYGDRDNASDDTARNGLPNDR